MATFAERLLEAGADPKIPWTIFLQNYNPRGHVIYVVVEGGDDAGFYPVHIRPRVGSQYRVEPVPMNGKDKVSDAIKEFLDRFQPNPRAMFILDKDFDDLLSNCPPTYPFSMVTSGYSVENYFICGNMVRTHCVEDLRIPPEPAVLDTIEEQFFASWRDFCRASLPIFAWMLAARRLKRKANLNNVKPADLIAVGGDSISFQLRLSGDALYRELERQTGGHQALELIPDADIEQASQILATRNPLAWVRGKQAKWFLLTVLSSIQLALKEANIPFKSIQLDSGNCVRILASRVLPAQELLDLIERVNASLRVS